MTTIKRPQLSIYLTTTQKRALNKYIPWGLSNRLFSRLVDDVIRILESGDASLIALLIEGKVKSEDILDSLKAKKDED